MRLNVQIGDKRTGFIQLALDRIRGASSESNPLGLRARHERSHPRLDARDLRSELITGALQRAVTLASAPAVCADPPVSISRMPRLQRSRMLRDGWLE